MNSTDIFHDTKNWQYSALDQRAEAKFSTYQNEAREAAPQEFYHSIALFYIKVHTLTHLEYMRATKLYSLLKTLPKAVMHHNHFDCNEDQQFYRQYVVTDPNIYLSEDRKNFKVGNKEQAQQQKWVSFGEVRKEHNSEEEFVKAVSNITMFSKTELQKLSSQQTKIWEQFEIKISGFFPLIFTLHVFKKYTKYVLLKYIANGYDRIEFRAFLGKLNEYDQNGNFIKEHDQKMYMEAFDQVYTEVKQAHPQFSAAFVFFGLKAFNEQQNTALFTKICQLNWDKTIGLDFVQQEDLFGSLEEYDKVIDKVLAKFPLLNYKKVYHAGQTKDHLTHNIDIAVKAGSVRIGHGLNILQRVQFLPHCKHICFEKNPISNLILGYKNDTREASAPILLGLGYAVTINPDDPGKFGLEDTTADYFVAAVSYNWTLKHLKLIAYHSINHAICDEMAKRGLLQSFNFKWHDWICNFVGEESMAVPHLFAEPDIYTTTNHWIYTQDDQQAEAKFEIAKNCLIKSLPEEFYGINVLNHLEFMKKSQLYPILSTLPKGALHHDHFDCNEDEQFYRLHIATDPNVYLDKNRQLKVGTKKQAQQNNWISMGEQRKYHKDQQQFIKSIAKISIIYRDEMEQVSGQLQKFWPLFGQKFQGFYSFLHTEHIFKKYVRHVLNKLIKNGYGRVEFRALLNPLTEYDSQGSLVNILPYRSFMTAFDEVYNQIKIQHPHFTVGFIFVGLKMWSEEEVQDRLSQVCQLNWDKTVGLDFLQEEDRYGSIEKFDKVADKVLMKYPHLNYKKVYHAGDTKDHLNHNIQIAVKAGSVRIGHGLNIVQKIEFLKHCKGVCFQLNPISNLIGGRTGRRDLRQSTAPLLLGLGYPVSISSDDPGKFGYEDTTVDYFVSVVSFNWTLKHLKLISIHSINHAVCTQGVRKRLNLSFNQNWDKWVKQYLGKS